jgi:hypothetical protein
MELELSQAIDHLERTPRTLHELLLGLPEPWLRANEGALTFSARDVLGHLIHGEETDWIPRLRLILEHGERVPFVPFDRFGFREKYSESSTPALLDRFAELRRDNLKELRSLSSHQLELPGAHPELGRVTMKQLIATWVVHDWTHLFQVTRVMARQYEEAVGPWKAYLRILGD